MGPSDYDRMLMNQEAVRHEEPEPQPNAEQTGHYVISRGKHDELWDAHYALQRKINDGLTDLRQDIERLLTRIADVEVENARLRHELDVSTGEWRELRPPKPL